MFKTEQSASNSQINTVNTIFKPNLNSESTEVENGKTELVDSSSVFLSGLQILEFAGELKFLGCIFSSEPCPHDNSVFLFLRKDGTYYFLSSIMKAAIAQGIDILNLSQKAVDKYRIHFPPLLSLRIPNLVKIKRQRKMRTGSCLAEYEVAISPTINLNFEYHFSFSKTISEPKIDSMTNEISKNFYRVLSYVGKYIGVGPFRGQFESSIAMVIGLFETTSLKASLKLINS